MLWTISVILLILWALGLVSSYTMGGFIHILLVIAVIVVVAGFFQGRKSRVGCARFSSDRTERDRTQ